MSAVDVTSQYNYPHSRLIRKPYYPATTTLLRYIPFMYMAL